MYRTIIGCCFGYFFSAYLITIDTEYASSAHILGYGFEFRFFVPVIIGGIAGYAWHAINNENKS